jgi:acyl-CoA thioester hydrolase
MGAISMKNKPGAAVELEIPFHDVDIMGVVWHGHYLKYFEQARDTLLRRIDCDYPQMCELGYMWPVVKCNIKYIRPVRYAQRIKIEAQMMEYENRLRIAYIITDVTNGEKLAKGETIQLAIDMKTKELQFVSPQQLVARVEKAINE